MLKTRNRKRLKVDALDQIVSPRVTRSSRLRTITDQSCSKRRKTNFEGCKAKRTSLTKAEQAWKKSMLNYSPTKNEQIPQERQITVNLEPYPPSRLNKLMKLFQLDNTRLSGFSWILSMSEQFYYDNAQLMLSKYRSETRTLCKVIKINFSSSKVDKWRKNFTNIHKLGEGNFGVVYKATDKVTKEDFALKILKAKPCDNLEDYYDLLIEYMQERNALIHARDSPFVNKFYGAYKEESIASTVLVFEFCITDLDHFIGELKDVEHDKFNELMYTKAKYDYNTTLNQEGMFINGQTVLPVLIIHFFECFCILDYLAKINLVHRDIKVDNILINSNFHLKLTDFGLIYNTYMVTDANQVQIVHHSAAKKFIYDENDYICGTNYYFDPEMAYARLKLDHESRYKKFEKFNEKCTSSFKNLETQSDFMSDTWAMAMTIITYLFIGEEFADRPNLSKNLKDQLNLIEPKKHSGFDLEDIMTIFATESNLKSFVVKGLKHVFKNTIFQAFIDFLVTALQPRKIRCKGFTKQKSVRVLDKQRTMRYLDIELISNIDIFRMNNFSVHNVFQIEISKDLIKKFVTKPNNTLKNYSEFIQTISKEKRVTKNIKEVEIKPGTEICML